MPIYRGSWYSQAPAFGWFDPEDKPNSAAYHVGGRPIPDSQQGIALPSRRTLGKWFNVTPPGGSTPYPMQQTDIGPAKWTGRGVDISAAAAHQMGYTPKNFPTDAAWKVEPRDEPRGLGSPAGMSVQAGDLPDNATGDTATASGPSQQQGRRMPNSLMDMFTPRDIGGQPTGFGDMLAQRSNSLIGLGLGLMSGTAQDPYGNALRGYAQGAGSDQDRYQSAQRLAEQRAARAASLAEQRAGRAQAQSNWERQFERSDPAKALTDAQRAYRDIYGAPGSPDYKGTPETQQEFFKQFYLPKTEQPAIVWQEDSSGNKVPYRQDPRSGTVTPIPLPSQATTSSNPYVTGGKMSVDEGKTALFADRAATAHAAITAAENLNQEPGGSAGALVEQNLPAGVANVLVSGPRGKSMDAQRAFVNALLRRESGAAISAGEFGSYAKEYFPQLGDTPEQIESKRKHRAEVIAGLAREGGKGYRPTYSFDESGRIRLGAPTYTGTAPQGGGPAPPAPAGAATFNERFSGGGLPPPPPGFQIVR